MMDVTTSLAAPHAGHKPQRDKWFATYHSRVATLAQAITKLLLIYQTMLLCQHKFVLWSK